MMLHFYDSLTIGPLIAGMLLGEPEKVPTFENSCHQDYFTDLNDSG